MTTTRATRATRAAAGAGAAARQAGRWIEKLARLGFLAKAAVYGLIGVLALRLAFGLGGETTDPQGALREIAGAPFGTALLVLVALGLFGYAAWRLVQGALDVDGVGSDGKGLVKRAGYLGSGVLHALLALSALSLVAGGSGGGGAGDEQAWTARLLSHDWGVWLVGLAGLIAIGVGLYQLHLAREARFLRRWRSGAMSAAERTWGERAGRAGLAARGVVFALVGWFLLRAAWQTDPGEARGLGGALAEIAAAAYGGWLLALVALGLVCYAVFCVLEARYRQLGVR